MPIVKTDVYDVQAPFALDLRLVKADMNARNAIGTFQRYVGMTVFVLSENTFWQLQGGTTNDDWVEVEGADNFAIQSVVVNTGAPTGGNDGDIWFRQVGNSVTVYQKVSGTWSALGVIDMGLPTRTPSATLSLSTTSSELDGDYPAASVGDIIYRVSTFDIYVAEKIESGVWSIEQRQKA